MDQQHQSYESFNDFGFVNSFGSGNENYSISQPSKEMNSNSLNDLTLPTLINTQDYDNRSIPPLYELPEQQQQQSEQYPSLQYHGEQSNETTTSFVQSVESNNSKVINQNMEMKNTISPLRENLESAPSTSKAVNEAIVRKEVQSGLSTSSSKKRRRIVLLNDDDDSDEASELKKELLNKSSELDEVVKNDKDEIIKNGKSGNGSEADNESEHEETENLTDLGALKAKYLLKNAVIIQDPDKKKKKSSRVLDSDEDDQLQTATSVDDIGLMNENEEEEESFDNGILIAEPIIPISSNINTENTEINEKMDEKKSEVEQQNIENMASEEKKDIESKTSQNESDQVVNTEPEPVKTEIISANESKISPGTEDNEIDPSMSVEAILDKIKPMADDDEFFKFDKSDEDKDKEKSLTNEEYFGTPDKSQANKPPGKKRGPKPGSKRAHNIDPSLRRKRGDRYEDDFVDDSESDSGSSDSDYTESSSSESSVEELRPRGRPPLKPGRPPIQIKKPPVYVPMKSYSSSNLKRKAKKDRFYDRSRDIPNDVYFGDVKVPLHILHTKWGSDNDSDDDGGDFRCSKISHSNHKHSYNHIYPSTSSHHSRPQFTYIHDHTEEPKLSALREFIHLCGIKINYQKLFENISSTDQKCMILRRIMAQKGMEGEPTVAKCKKIRRELQAKRESMELDKSVIIHAEGRTRRSVRNATKVSSYTEKSDDNYKPSISSAPIVQPETLHTLSRIRNVIDSDSD